MILFVKYLVLPRMELVFGVRSPKSGDRSKC